MISFSLHKPVSFLVATTCMVLALSACQPAKKAAKKSAKETEPSVRLTLVPMGKLHTGQPTDVLAKLTHNKGLYVLNDNDLETVHTRKFHLLVVDPTLTDYQHIHPVATETPGLYRFTFTPHKTGGYRAWADITPKQTGQQEFTYTDLGRLRGLSVTRTDSYEATVDGYRFQLSFSEKPAKGGEAHGTITVATASGAPVTSLEPVMGAYGHIVGFYDDFRTVIHTHPMGDEPQNESDRGGPSLSFHLEPQKAGFVKLFAQVKINGRELFVPFGFTVAEAQ